MRSFFIALLFTLKCAWAQQACSYSMRFFDVDECERFNTPFVQTTIIADGTCRGQSTGKTGPGPYYQAVCGNDRIFFLKANCNDSACTDCEEKSHFRNNFDGDGWSPKSPCIPLPESAWSFNIKSGSCDPDKCAVPERLATPSPTDPKRSQWPTWYEPTFSPPTASPQTSLPTIVADIIATQGPILTDVSPTSTTSQSPETPTATTPFSPNQTPTALSLSPDQSQPIQPVSTPTSKGNQSHSDWAWRILFLPVVLLF